MDEWEKFDETSLSRKEEFINEIWKILLQM